MFNNPTYIDDAIHGNVEGICFSLNQVYKLTLNPQSNHPYQKAPHSDIGHQNALIAAIRHGQMDVVITLLNYETSPKNNNLLNEQAKLTGITEAIQCGAHEMITVLIQHLKKISPATYNSIKKQLSAYYSKMPATDEAKRQLSRLMITLLECPTLMPHPRRTLETLRDIGIKHGCIDLIQYLVAHGLSFVTLHEHEQALIAMDFADTQNNLELLQAFPELEIIMDNQIAPDTGDTPFIAAARVNNLALMKHIYLRDSKQLLRRNRRNQTALMAAAESDTPAKECIAWLLMQGMDITEPFNEKTSILEKLAGNQAQCDALEFVINYPDPKIYDVLIDTNTCNRLLKKILSVIAHRQHESNDPMNTSIDLLGPLIALNNRHMDGEAPQLSANALNARYFKHEAIVPWEMHTPKSKRKSFTQALFTNATQSKDRYALTPIDAKDHKGRTALHHLMLNGSAHLAHLLYPLTSAQGSITTINILSLNLITALPDIFSDEQAEMTLTKLLSHHASIDITDKHGNTPLHYACTYHIAYIIERLLEKGANPNQANEFGETPLMHACRFNTLPAILSLLNHGADASLKDTDEHDAFYYLKTNSVDVQESAAPYLLNALNQPRLRRR